MNNQIFKVLLCCLVIPAFSWAGVVSHLEDKGKGSFRWAIENANEGETISFSSDIVGRTIVLKSPINVPTRSIRIEGPNRQIIISAPFGSVFSNISSKPFQLNGISFRDAFSILQSDAKGRITIENCSFRNIENCFPSIVGTLEVGNSSFYKNQGILREGGERVEFYQCNMESNQGVIVGGKKLQELLLENCYIELNEAPVSKGLFYLEKSENLSVRLEIRDCEFVKNQTPKGAIISSQFNSGKNHRIDFSSNVLSQNQGKIVYCILEGDAMLELNQGNTAKSTPPCDEKTDKETQSAERIFLGNDSFPYFCEGVVIYRRSQRSQFTQLKANKIHKVDHNSNCCNQRVKIF